ncbi:MAG: hypothetical protein QMC40_05710, partial [Vicingaceae bacterium]
QGLPPWGLEPFAGLGGGAARTAIGHRQGFAHNHAKHKVNKNDLPKTTAPKTTKTYFHRINLFYETTFCFLCLI